MLAFFLEVPGHAYFFNPSAYPKDFDIVSWDKVLESALYVIMPARWLIRKCGTI